MLSGTGFPHISNIDSQTDGHIYRMIQHLSRQGWRSVESIGVFSHPLTKFQREMSVIDYEITYIPKVAYALSFIILAG
jgi:hypothetical protein